MQLQKQTEVTTMVVKGGFLVYGSSFIKYVRR